MLEISTIFFVYLISLNLASFLGGAFSDFLSITKKEPCYPKKWQNQLQKMELKGIVRRLHVSYMIALSILAIINYNLAFQHSIAYTITLLIAGIFHLSYKYQLNKDHLTKKFN
ncbi:MAG: hypothetical protein IC227_11185 [Enterococcus lacertideformus]|uniref:DUF3784 domain-containing protein n=1 Tax=Enterococcus lacertideformus TaxID=2771493 RepID=A0A931AZK1_9ENTE|nr:hypothetical protein [Enterococcus lacertideformus]